MIPAERRSRSSYRHIRYDKREHVVTIALDRPEVHNCINAAMSAELQTAWKTFRDDDDAFVAIITGAGDRAFSAGWDLKEAAALTDLGTFDQFRVSVYNSEGYCGYTRRVDIFKPIIAAVNGFCFAAGLETALLADIRIAAERAEFGCLERRWNIVAGDGLTARLPLVVGFARAMELLITGRRIEATEALRIGLVTEVVPNDRLRERMVELAQSIAELPQGAIRFGQGVRAAGGRPHAGGATAHRSRNGALDVPAAGQARPRRRFLRRESEPRMEAPRPVRVTLSGVRSRTRLHGLDDPTVPG